MSEPQPRTESHAESRTESRTDPYRIRMPWAEVRTRLVGARSYWICTASAAGTPHAMPVWGVWVGGRLWFSTGAGTVKARNLAANPRVSVHLESAAELVSLRGRAEVVAAGERPAAVDEAYAEKYAMPRTGEPASIHVPGAPIYSVTPTGGVSWYEGAFAESMTRWTFPGPVGEPMSYPADPADPEAED